MKPTLLIRELFQTYKIHKFILAIIVIVITASLAVPGYEQGHPKANIKDFNEALWWSLVTVAAVGYGDHYPVSFGGRMVAVFLMFLGVTFTSTVVALVASYYASRRTQRDWTKIFQKLEDIEEKLDKINKKSEYLIKNETKNQSDSKYRI